MACETRHPAREARLAAASRPSGLKWLGWAALLCCGLIAVACRPGGSSSPAANEPLRWGADAEGGAPYLFTDPDNPDRYIGFEVDLKDELAKRLGRPIEFLPSNFSSLAEGLERGDFEFAMNGLEDTPDRRRDLLLSRPYYVYRLQLAVRKDEQRIASIDDCTKPGMLIGTLSNTAASRLLEARGITPQSYDGQREPYLDLEAGRLDAVLMDVPIAVEQLKTLPSLRPAGQPFAMGFYVIAFSRSQEALARQFDAALQGMAGDGTLERVYKKWGLWNADQFRLADAEPTLDADPGTPAPGKSVADGTPQASGTVTSAISSGAAASDGAADSDTPKVQKAASFLGYFPSLLRGASVTVLLSIASMALAMVLGLIIALCRMYGPRPVQWMAITYIEFFRGVPVLLLLYTMYFGLPILAKALDLDVNISLPGYVVAFIVFGMNYAAYEAEIYRAGLTAIPEGQWEAAASLGMSRFTTLRRIILPQTLRIIMPPVTNDFVALLKDTSLVSTISMIDLTKAQLQVARSHSNYFETGIVAALMYLTMSIPLGYLARQMEKRWASGG